MQRATLFERLTEKELDRGHDRLRRSIARNLAALLNTRTSPGAIVEYGLPDLAEFYAGNERDRGRLEDLIAARVARYEPRLGSVRVTLRPDRLNPRGLTGSIDARLLSDAPLQSDARSQSDVRLQSDARSRSDARMSSAESVSFPIALEERHSECRPTTPNPSYGTTPTS